MSRTVETEYMGELKAAAIRRPRVSANILLLTIFLFVVWAIWWANGAKLDEVTVGMGRVIPSSEIQTVQNLEGGIISEIKVREGALVSKGQTLITIDDTQFRSKYREDRSKQLSLMAMVARLEAEVSGREPVFPKELKNEAASITQNELASFRAREFELESAIKVLERQKDQRKQELVELRSQIKQLKKSLSLGQEEVKILRPTVEQGATSKMELIRLQREVNDIESALLAAKQSVPRAKSAMAEIEQQIEEKHAGFLSRARAELNEAETNLRALSESMMASEDRLQRTDVVSPVNGTIKQVLVNTVGGVIRPGMDLVAIVPRDDSLLVEARVRPSDIAFLRPGQEAKVKITAYDYSVYGTLDAKLEHISADTIIDEKQESYYEIRVRTSRNYLENGDEQLPIIPGMVSEVDILTGEKTVLEYLLKPILRAKQKALRER